MAAKTIGIKLGKDEVNSSLGLRFNQGLAGFTKVVALIISSFQFCLGLGCA